MPAASASSISTMGLEPDTWQIRLIIWNKLKLLSRIEAVQNVSSAGNYAAGDEQYAAYSGLRMKEMERTNENIIY